MNRIFIIFLACLLSGFCRAQYITQKDIIGTWIVNDTSGIHKSFKAQFTFTNDSRFLVNVNGKIYQEFLYKFYHNDSSYVIFKNQEDSTYEGFTKHRITIKGDTLFLSHYYFYVRPEYELPENDVFYFTRAK